MDRTNRRSAFGWNLRSRRRRELSMERLESRELLAATSQDFLYVGDSSNDSIQQFDASTGAYIGTLVPPGSAGLHGPRGIVLDQGNLLVVNQNINLPKNGEVLRYTSQSGAPTSPLVPALNPNAPFAPAGMVVRENVVYVADTGEGSPAGRIVKFNATTGAFLGDLNPSNFKGEFRPRGLVFGPDGGLYVTVSSIGATNSSDPPGYILRFDVATGIDRVVAWNDGDGIDESGQGEAADLHNPIGLVFAPNGKIYVTSNRKDGQSNDENTRIVIIDPATGKELNHIELDPHSLKSPTRLYAQALVFGPNGKLFIPVTVESLSDGTASGAIVTYDPATQQIATFFASSPFQQTIVLPSYLTFKQTDPATLAYKPWHNFVNPVDINDDGSVSPLDVLLIINELNKRKVTDASGRLPDSRATSNFFYDVNGDGFVAPLDAWLVINFLVARVPRAEGESAPLASAESLGFLNEGDPAGDSVAKVRRHWSRL